MSVITVPGALTGAYTIDPAHSRIGFAVRSTVTRVRGSFTSFEGTGHFDATNPASSTIEVRIDAASIDTGNARRDAHLRNEAFLGADEHPDLRFTSTSVEPVGDEHYQVTGDLTMKGTTLPVTVDIHPVDISVDEHGSTCIDFRGHAVLRRTDWGVQWSPVLEGGGLVISNLVVVDIAVRTVRRSSDDRWTDAR